ncbi:MAG: hypothetical protein A3F10_00680 [Coxiella sp. RIFCSPHIGHO2_12_FULL_42_15]|nr:MAG: hypothetical protein A3F10_00680 [Coxiella sp. RIFCSPHIGHO2_12_FULL_42_15]
MMIKKIFAIRILSSLVTLSIASSAMANLTIINNSNITQIEVKCSGPKAGVPISKNHTISLPWLIIKPILGGLTGTCSFYNNGRLEAIASLNISPTLMRATITDFTLTDPNLQVSFIPGVHTQAAEIAVTVAGG